MPEKVLIAGTGAESATETLNLTEYAAELGYDVALVRTPFYYKKQMQPANMLAFYRTVADCSPLPVLIYSVPPFTGYDMPVELIVELLANGWTYDQLLDSYPPITVDDIRACLA